MNVIQVMKEIYFPKELSPFIYLFSFKFSLILVFLQEKNRLTKEILTKIIKDKKKEKLMIRLLYQRNLIWFKLDCVGWIMFSKNQITQIFRVIWNEKLMFNCSKNTHRCYGYIFFKFQSSVYLQLKFKIKEIQELNTFHLSLSMHILKCLGN